MSLFIDASVIVAILAEEDDAEALLDRLENTAGPFFVSAVVRFEAVLSIAGRRARGRLDQGAILPADIEAARQLVDGFIADMDAREVRIGGDITEKAIDAATRFGKVVGHPAKLNMGDCFAYACAQGYHAGLAFKGVDFPHTDLGWSGTSAASTREVR